MDTYGTKQQHNTQRIVGKGSEYADHVGPGPRSWPPPRSPVTTL